MKSDLILKNGYVTAFPGEGVEREILLKIIIGLTLASDFDRNDLEDIIYDKSGISVCQNTINKILDEAFQYIPETYYKKLILKF
jgi:hypothetical protein